MAERFRMDGNEIAKTRAAFADRASALNDLRSAKLTEVEMHKQNLDTRAAAAEAEAAQALETGDWQKHASQQRAMSELAVARARAEDAQRYWQNRPIEPPDPVEALIQSKSSEPETVKWLRSHPESALVLATNSDPTQVARIQAAHHAALAEHHVAGSAEYFRHIDRALGSLGGKTTSGSDNEGGKRVVRVVKGRQSGDNELTAGELRAANEDVLWGREGGAKCGTPIGVEEYIKRRNAMRAQPGWFDKLD